MTPGQIAYREYLQSEHWQNLRAEALKKWGHVCHKCRGWMGIEVHHCNYRKNWRECTVDDVRPLCWRCHDLEHGREPTKPAHVAKIERKIEQFQRELRKERRQIKRWKKMSHRKRQRIEQINRQRFNPHKKKRPHWVQRGNSSN